MPVKYYNHALKSILQSNGENMLGLIYFDNRIQKLVAEADECHQC